jgi:hypothetical protein
MLGLTMGPAAISVKLEVNTRDYVQHSVHVYSDNEEKVYTNTSTENKIKSAEYFVSKFSTGIPLAEQIKISNYQNIGQ